jgi:hypothetical protein
VASLYFRLLLVILLLMILSNYILDLGASQTKTVLEGCNEIDVLLPLMAEIIFILLSLIAILGSPR